MEFWQWLAEACIPGVVVGVVMYYFNRKQSSSREAEAEAEARRIKADLLRTDLLVATASLSYAVAMAIKRGAPNGEIEEGVERYDKAMEKFRDFEREQMVKAALE